MPCKNELGNLTTIIERLVEVRNYFQDRDLEIIIVDGHSTDGSWEKLIETSQKYPYFKILKQELPLGVGRAARQGLLAAKNDILASSDCDLNIDHRYICQFVEALEQEGYDFVIANPWNWKLWQGYSVFRMAISRILVLFCRLAFYPKAKDLQNFSNIFRVFKRDLFYKTLPKGGSITFSFEVLSKAVLNNYRIKQIEVQANKRGEGVYAKSKTRSRLFFHFILRYLWLILLIRLRIF